MSVREYNNPNNWQWECTLGRPWCLKSMEDSRHITKEKCWISAVDIKVTQSFWHHKSSLYSAYLHKLHVPSIAEGLICCAAPVVCQLSLRRIYGGAIQKGATIGWRNWMCQALTLIRPCFFLSLAGIINGVVQMSGGNPGLQTGSSACEIINHWHTITHV